MKIHEIQGKLWKKVPNYKAEKFFYDKPNIKERIFGVIGLDPKFDRLQGFKQVKKKVKNKRR